VYQMIVTAGEDGKIKLWDVRSNGVVETLKGHRGTVNGVRFGVGGNNLCSVSSDRTMKQWDCAQRGTFYIYHRHNINLLWPQRRSSRHRLHKPQRFHIIRKRPSKHNMENLKINTNNIRRT
jgi:WD40 repeat protein